MRKILYAVVAALIVAALIKTGAERIPSWKGKRVSGNVTLRVRDGSEAWTPEARKPVATGELEMRQPPTEEGTEIKSRKYKGAGEAATGQSA